jgi:hypothetical protein
MGWVSVAALMIAELAKKFTFETAKYVAMRAFLILLTLTIAPIAIFWGYSYILEHVLSYASGYLTGQGLAGVNVDVAGLGGWVAARLRVGEAIAILLSFSLLSFTLKAIRLK